jgi:hypothetical protein
MQWLRLYHDTITDPKWRVVAAESGQPLTAVLAVWMSMLINASDADERGTLQGWDDRFAGAAIDLRGDAVRAIRESMQGVVLDGNRLTGWDKRQRVASDDAADRQRRSRANRQSKTPPNGTGGGHSGNGADPDVTRQSRDNEDLSRDNEAMSRDSHKTPLTLTLLPTPTLTKDDDETARARLVAERVAELAMMDARRIRVAMVEAWLAAGCDPEQDVYPAVRHCVGGATAPISSGWYFDAEVRRFHAARISPPSNVSYLPSASGGGRGKAMSGAASDLLKAFNGGIIEIGGIP